jgi:hypothetical protein
MTLPYDPEGSNPLNLKTESKRLSDTPNTRRCIVPTYAPFYRTDFILATPDGVELYEGMHYYFGHYYKALSEALKRPVFGSIVLIDPDLDEVEFKRYRSVGGNHMAQPSHFAKYLVNPELSDPRSTDWSDILQRVIDIEVESPPESIDEAIERDDMARALNDLTTTVKDNLVVKDSNLKQVVDKLIALSDSYTSTLYERHVQDTGQNAHPLTTTEINAANRSDVAPNTVFLYGADKNTVLARMRAFLLQHSDLAELANRSDAILMGVIALAEGVSIVCDDGLRVEQLQNELHITNGKSIFRINIAKGPKNKSTFRLSANGNMFAASSLKSVCYYNGLPILTTEYADQYLNPNLGKADKVYSSNTESVSLYGTGKEDDPLRGEVTVRNANTAQVGRFTVANDFSLGSVATSGYMYTVWQEALLKAEANFSINGVPYSQNTVLGKANINLSNVNNTLAKNKPLNNPFVSALGNKSRVGHKHQVTGLDAIRYANELSSGFIQYAETLVDDATLAAQFNQVYAAYDKLSNTDVSVDGMLPREYLNGYIYLNLTVTESVDDVTGDHTLTISDFDVLSSGIRTTITGGSYVNLEGTVSIVNGELAQTNVGLFVASRYSEVVTVFSPYNYSMTRSWLEHYVDPNAHAGAATQGIYSLLRNYGLVRDWDNPLINPLDSWNRWSHDSVVSEQPAREDELLAWGWDDSTVVSQSASNTFLTVISEPTSAFEYESLITFKDPASRDAVALVMGGWIDTQGVQRTISLVLSSRVTATSLLTGVVEVWLDYFQPTGKLIAVLDASTDNRNTWYNNFIHARVAYADGTFNLSYAIGDIVGDKDK